MSADREAIQRMIAFAEKSPHEFVRVAADELLEIARIAESATNELATLVDDEGRRREVPKLDTRASRVGLLTDRECAKLIGAIIGGLTEIAGLETIHRAVRWWANHEDPWEALRHTLAPDRLVDKH